VARLPEVSENTLRRMWSALHSQVAQSNHVRAFRVQKSPGRGHGKGSIRNEGKAYPASQKRCRHHSVRGVPHRVHLHCQALPKRVIPWGSVLLQSLQASTETQSGSLSVTMALSRTLTPDGRLLWLSEGRRLARAYCMSRHGGRVAAMAAEISVHRSDLSRWLDGLTRPSSAEAFDVLERVGIPFRSWMSPPVVQPCTPECEISSVSNGTDTSKPNHEWPESPARAHSA
jgi:hypothetical protein